MFLKTLTAEYLRLKYGARIPAEGLILDWREAPRDDEIEDSFLRHARRAGRSRFERAAYHISGTPERSHFLNITTGTIPSRAVLDRAKALGVSVTAFLTSVLILCFHQAQQAETSPRKRRQPVKIMIPVNLRRFYAPGWFLTFYRISSSPLKRIRHVQLRRDLKRGQDTLG